MDKQNEAYHADTKRIGKSGLDLVHKSPAHYYAEYLDPKRKRTEPTKALITGSLVHAAILEPDYFSKRYWLMDDSKIIDEIGGGNPRNTKKYREWKAAMFESNKEKELITADDYHTITGIVNSIKNHPAARMLFTEGVAEQRIDFIEPQTGVACKCKPDWLRADGIIPDLKTTDDASPKGFAKSIRNYRYDVQGAFYSDGYYYGTGKPCKGFVFVAVEKKPPFAVGVYYLPADVLEGARNKYLRDLETYKEALETNNWFAYSNEIECLDMPDWYKNQN